MPGGKCAKPWLEYLGEIPLRDAALRKLEKEKLEKVRQLNAFIKKKREKEESLRAEKKARLCAEAVIYYTPGPVAHQLLGLTSSSQGPI